MSVRQAHGPGARRGVPVAVAAVLVAVLAACTPGEPPAVPAQVAPATRPGPAEPPAAADTDRWVLPSTWSGARTVAPGWDRALGSRDGVVVGARTEPEGGVDVSAVAGTGEALWSARRAPGHGEVGLSRAADTSRTPVVVLTDEDAGTTIATGHVLVTGELLWGPVEVPGPLVGPGLVFGDEAATALDPTTGTPLPTTGTPVAEHDGWVVTVDGPELLGYAPTDHGRPAWRTALTSIGLTTPRALAAPAPTGTVLLGEPDADEGVLLELATGRAVAPRASGAARDGATGTIVTVAAGTATGHGPDGPLWSRRLPDGDVDVAAAGGALVYLREEGAVRVLNALTGADAIAYEGPAGSGYVVPTLVTSTGAAVARTDELVLLTTEPADPAD
ncbi:hypothetical protein GXB85_14965 [Cellulomonas sp. APG4]|uniref:hypothetical protein n=1 Tax=Cellulomonas sp. APG4 TaxID=1538656 RepID=UPI00137AA2BA|nr:hypothetical protein [Cellulomonas sp. APG4]NCT92241.1 hypothetical protein [Cellulomonas sp. APG4]